MPDIDWTNSQAKRCGRYTTINKYMLDICTDFNLVQIIDQPTRHDNILDLCFTSNPATVDHFEIIAGISDHDAVMIHTMFRPFHTKKPRRKIFLQKKANYTNISDDIDSFLNSSQINWQTMSINELWSQFKTCIQNAMIKNIPQKYITSRFGPPWITHALKKSIKKKQRLYNKAKQYSSIENWKAFKLFRRKLDRNIRKAYRNYVFHLSESLATNDSKPFWRFVKSKRKESFDIQCLNSNGEAVSSPLKMANILNSQFTSVFTHEPSNDTPLCDFGVDQYPSTSKLVISEPGILKLLQSLSPNKACGPDELPAFILKNCGYSISKFLVPFFQRTIDAGLVPNDWKNANIVPIFKKGDKRDPSNYRPISLTSCTSKLLEHVIYHHIMTHLDTHNALTDLQHGFRKARSCETQLITTVHDLASNLDKNIQTDLQILDFSKAFDTVPHRRLSSKLHFYGIRGPLLSWIESFLSNRTQTVVLNGYCSSSTRVLSGVPQGTVLGPLLFLLYINDLPQQVSSQIRLFADDCILYRQIRSARDCSLLQNDLNNLHLWQDKWLLKFNVAKCHTMSITTKKNPITFNYILNDSILSRVSSCPYLGINITHDLSWKSHIHAITGKARRTLGLLQRNLHACNPHVKEIAFKSIVRPSIEYCSSVWDPFHQTLIDSLEMIQRKGARFVHSDYARTSSVTPMLNTLKWPSLKTRRTRNRLSLLFKAVNGSIALNTDHLIPTTRNTRRNAGDLNFHQLQPRTNTFKYSYFPRTVVDWNALPNSAKTSSSVSSFKSSLEHLT